MGLEEAARDRGYFRHGPFGDEFLSRDRFREGQVDIEGRSPRH
jgi:hypothetical protein